MTKGKTMNDERRLQRALSDERKSRREIVDRARSELQAATLTVSELQTADRGLAVQYGALISDPVANWRELRDLEDERRFLKIAIQRAATARESAKEAVKRADLRARDAHAINLAASCSLKVAGR